MGDRMGLASIFAFAASFFPYVPIIFNSLKLGTIKLQLQLLSLQK